jgi:hypothetical protein
MSAIRDFAASKYADSSVSSLVSVFRRSCLTSSRETSGCGRPAGNWVSDGEMPDAPV